MRQSNIYRIIFVSFLVIHFLGFGTMGVYAEEEVEQEKEVIVVYKNETGKEEVIEKSNSVDYEFETVPAISVTATENDIEKLETDPNIEFVEENITFSIAEYSPTILQTEKDVLKAENQWNINAINAHQAWNEGYSGEGLKVGVLDTGVAKHRELNIAGGVSTVDYTKSYKDDNGHGTHVSGIIAAQPNLANVDGMDVVGVASGVDLYAIKVLDKKGTGSLQDILEGLDWAIASDMDIINLSFGSMGYSQLLEQMIDEANEKGMLIVAASGNEGAGNEMYYPAKFENVIAVSSVNEVLSISDFSTIGNEVDFSAPGENILSTYKDGKYAYDSGTSQATPHVTGMLALLKEKYPNKGSKELYSLLRENSKDLGEEGRDPYYGYGMVHYGPVVDQEPVIPSIYYSTHVQRNGWTDFVSDGEMSGTEGQAKRLEAIQITLENTPYDGGVVYSTHVQSYGWLDEVSNGTTSGTSGESKRMEAIRIKLTGELANHYDIYYQVHAESYGWLDWAKNGEDAGTAGIGKRLEAIKIVLVEKGEGAPGSTSKPFVVNPSISYATHVQSYGWMNFVKDGKMSGTSGQAKRLEAIQIRMENTPFSGDIVYSTHVQNYGWLKNVKNGAMSGTSGQSKRLEAIKIHLTGGLAKHYDVYYRVHVQSYGWLDWVKNGETAGTTGQAKRLEAIEIKLVQKN